MNSPCLDCKVKDCIVEHCVEHEKWMMFLLNEIEILSEFDKLEIREIGEINE